MKRFFKTYIGDLYPTRRFYLVGGILSALLMIRHFVAGLGMLPIVLLWAFIVLFCIEYSLLFFRRNGLDSYRRMPGRFSNGDLNDVVLHLTNRYSFPVHITIVDEIPAQFQRRDIAFKTKMDGRSDRAYKYQLRPVKRGVYQFGTINNYVSCLLGLLQRRFKNGEAKDVAVYPSYQQLRKYQLLALHNQLQDTGQKRLQQIGSSFEFDQIREYVIGDDYRTVNWKATARKGTLMVNHYTEEKSQPIYAVIDKGRLMEMPFDQMSLLDYAINASLVLSHIAIYKEDKAGLVTFAKKPETLLLSDRKPGQMLRIQEHLYHEKTAFPESAFERLYITIKRHVTQRSFLILFTNFESVEALHRQLPYLRKIAQAHLLLVVFFQNSIVKSLVEKPAETLKEMYTQTIAEQFDAEKKLIVQELQRYGIMALLTSPQNLTANTINKYLEVKRKHLL